MEAHAAVAAIAFNIGMIDFVKHGSPKAIAKCGLVLAPLNVPGLVQEPSRNNTEEGPAVKKTKKCCIEWCAGYASERCHVCFFHAFVLFHAF